MTNVNVLSLYKNMLRNASKFQDYSYRSYAVRRVKDGFRKNQHLQQGSTEQIAAMEHAQNQAQILYRQVILSQLYPPPQLNVLEQMK